jgi:hypothetical protein
MIILLISHKIYYYLASKFLEEDIIILFNGCALKALNFIGSYDKFVEIYLLYIGLLVIGRIFFSFDKVKDLAD